MSFIAISLMTFAFVFGGALLGIALRAVLPQSHLTAESRDVVRLGMGLVSTTAALVLGLLTSSAKSSFDAQSNELTEMSSKVILLDRVLAHYGPEAQGVRDELRISSVSALGWVSSSDDVGSSQLPATNREVLYDKIQALAPKNDVQRSIQGEALNVVTGLGEIRSLIIAQRFNSVPAPLLIVVIFWLTIIFISFGLFAPGNATVIVTLLVSALSVSGAIFLIIEMYSPYSGLIHVSIAPLRAALTQLGQ